MDTTSWDLTAIIVLFAGAVIVSLCTAIVAKWSLIRFAVELEYRIDGLEQRISSEVKKRAQEKSVEQRKGNQSLVDWANSETQEPQAHAPPKASFNDWYRKKMVGKS